MTVLFPKWTNKLPAMIALGAARTAQASAVRKTDPVSSSPNQSTAVRSIHWANANSADAPST